MSSGTIEIEFSHKQLTRDLRKFTARQVPFAFSVALNETIVDTQHALQDELPTTFTVRNQWTKKGIRVAFANKARLEATVGSVDPYMADQAVGGVRTKGGGKRRGGKSGPVKNKSLAVPVGARPRKKSKTPLSKHPGALVKKKGGFIAGTKRGTGGKLSGGTSAVYTPRKPRKRKGRKGAARPKLRLMYMLVPRVKIKKAWDLEETLQRVVAQEWRGNMATAWKRALRTGRRRR